ncbi:lactonase family protein [Coralloluteibacterium stylophorae]|uniref:Lactonase family protein n=1 Tax=Coralloluteibacterium stylophorae TaxID=1776034 RepID=A0A8J7VQA8_9GAMM|nr:lactonase family protein [Coralloluteibacterium stylophorae]MBS7456903.1 lactonase family protein [Coralloluteibacterium stylophorae]
MEKHVIGSMILGAATALSAATPAATQTLLVGTYTAGDSEGIHVYDFDPQRGRIAPAPRQVVAAENPSWLVPSPDGRVVYAVNENGPGQADPVGRVSAFRVDPADHTLALASQVRSLGAEPTHAGLSRDGRFLFVANYSVAPDPGGTLAVVPVADATALQPPVQVKTHRASRVDPERQQSPHVHSAVVSPDGARVYAQDLGSDRIYVYRYDAARPELPLSRDPEQPEIELPPGSGPRHLVFAADGRHAWLTLEMSGEVVAFARRDGRLEAVQRVPLAAPGFSGKNGAAALHLSADGRFLYVSNRGTANELVSFAVGDDGRLELLARRSTEGEEPREFALAPDGRHVLVANQRSDAIVVMRRDPQTGLIGETVQVLEVDAPSDLKFLP